MAEEKKKRNKKASDKSFITTFKRTLKGFAGALPILAGVVLLVGLFKSFVPEKLLSQIFTGNLATDTFLGAIVGSISAGNPLTSYIIGGEFLKRGIGLLAVTAFLVSWVTVGIIQLPAEAEIMGKKFALTRNIVSFILSMVIAAAAVLILGLF